MVMMMPGFRVVGPHNQRGRQSQSTEPLQLNHSTPLLS
jgi:hypothetical protein